MARIVLEDIKVNKTKKQIIPPKQEPIFRSKPIESTKNVLKKNIVQKDIPQMVAPQELQPEEIEPKIEKESKIDEYFKNLSSGRQKIPTQRLQSTPQIKRKSQIISRTTIIVFFIVIILGGIYWGGNILQKANITITSKQQSISYNNKQFLASKDSTIGAVDFEIMITSDKKKKNIILTDSKEVSIKATGSITLYNEFSTTAQKIIAGTFLSDNSGKSYKTNNTITIPGYKIVNKKVIPGQVVVAISSFLPGEAYNGEPSDFHINSFKGTTKYNKIYGKLKTPLSGGASGFVYIMNDSDKSKAENIAQTSFKEDMIEKVKALVPPGYILYPEAFTFSYKIGGDVLSKTPEAEIEIDGELSAVLLKEKSLINNILKISLPEIKDDESKEITILNLNTLSFAFVNKDQVIDKEIASIPFLLNGNADIIWRPDTEILKTKLQGVNKNEVLSIFRQDPGIAGAMVKIFPPWRTYIPNDVSKININLQ